MPKHIGQTFATIIPLRLRLSFLLKESQPKTTTLRVGRWGEAVVHPMPASQKPRRRTKLIIPIFRYSTDPDILPINLEVHMVKYRVYGEINLEPELNQGSALKVPLAKMKKNRSIGREKRLFAIDCLPI